MDGKEEFVAYRCPVCGSDDFEYVGEDRIDRTEELQTYHCNACGVDYQEVLTYQYSIVL